jgi:hypothetical protein
MGIAYGEKWQDIFNSIEHVCTNFNSLFNVDAIRHSISTLITAVYKESFYSSVLQRISIQVYSLSARSSLSFSLSLSLLQTPLLMSPRRL